VDQQRGIASNTTVSSGGLFYVYAAALPQHPTEERCDSLRSRFDERHAGSSVPSSTSSHDNGHRHLNGGFEFVSLAHCEQHDRAQRGAEYIRFSGRQRTVVSSAASSNSTNPVPRPAHGRVEWRFSDNYSAPKSARPSSMRRCLCGGIGVASSTVVSSGGYVISSRARCPARSSRTALPAARERRDRRQPVTISSGHARIGFAIPSIISSSAAAHPPVRIPHGERHQVSSAAR